MKRTVVAALTVLALAVTTSGCGGFVTSDAGNEAGPGLDPIAQIPDSDYVVTEPPRTPPPVATPDGELEPTPEQTESGADYMRLCQEMGPTWCTDSDGNYVPDAVELLLGYNPEVDDCAELGQCPTTDVEAAIQIAAQPVLILVDGSEAMKEPLTGSSTSRINHVKDAIHRLVIGTPDFVATGMTTFGMDGDSSRGNRIESCGTVESVAFPGDVTVNNVTTATEDLQGVGWRPVAMALDIAGAVAHDAGNGRILLFTSGYDNCEGNVLRSWRDAVEGTSPVVDVIGLQPIPSEEEAALRTLAESSGGQYHGVTAETLIPQIEQEVNRAANRLAPATCVTALQGMDRSCHDGFRDAVAAYLGELSDSLYTQGDNYQAELTGIFSNVVLEYLMNGTVPEGAPGVAPSGEPVEPQPENEEEGSTSGVTLLPSDAAEDETPVVDGSAEQQAEVTYETLLRQVTAMTGEIRVARQRYAQRYGSELPAVDTMSPLQLNETGE